MIRWGVIGLGNMATKFCEAIKEVDNAELKGISSKSKLSLTKFGKSFNIDEKYQFKHYQELIDCSDVDAVYISTLNNTHFDLIKASIQNNKKILCEKPLGLNSIEVNEIYNLIKNKNNIFFEAIAVSSLEHLFKRLEISKNKNFGKIKKIEANFGFKVKKIKKDSRLFNKLLGGGSILDLGCYPISFFNLFVNNFSEIDIIKTYYDLCETNVDIRGEIHLKLNNETNAIGRVSLSENLNNICRMHFQNAIITIPSPWLPSEKTFIEIETKGRYFKEFITSDKSVYRHQLETISSFFNGKHAKNTHLVDIEESLEISKILDAWLN